MLLRYSPFKAPGAKQLGNSLSPDYRPLRKLQHPDQHDNAIDNDSTNHQALGLDCRGPEQNLSMAALPTLAPQSRNSKRRCPGRLCSARLHAAAFAPAGHMLVSSFAERRAQLEFDFPVRQGASHRHDGRRLIGSGDRPISGSSFPPWRCRG